MSHLIADAQDVQAHLVGVLKDVSGKVVWQCEHLHRQYRAAIECAEFYRDPIERGIRFGARRARWPTVFAIVLLFVLAVQTVRAVAPASAPPVQMPTPSPTVEATPLPTPTSSPWVDQQAPPTYTPAATPEPTLWRPTIPPLPTVQDAKDYALDQLGEEQYECLNDIVMHESRWDPLASNGRGSGAYGIPQAWPANKMASAGDDWETNPVTQVKWMIDYVDTKYGSACGAANYRNVHGIY